MLMTFIVRSSDRPDSTPKLHCNFSDTHFFSSLLEANPKVIEYKLVEATEVYLTLPNTSISPRKLVTQFNYSKERSPKS